MLQQLLVSADSHHHI